jgi:hypothetical protein
MNRGKEYFKLIKKYLEEEVGYRKGIKHNNYSIDEVEIITSDVKQEVRERIKDAFLEGVCKVIIGTATIREGIDLQTYGTSLYNLYPDWNPTDVKQLEGRIWRQGNTFAYVRIVMPLVENSMDVFVFQKLEEKTARVNDIWYRADRGNVLDMDSLDPEEVKFALFTNIEELAKIEIDKQERELNRKFSVLRSNADVVSKLEFNIRSLEQYRGYCMSIFRNWALNLKEFINDPMQYARAFGESSNPKKMKEYAERAVEVLTNIELALENPAFTNKELLAISREMFSSVFPSRGVVSSSRSTFENFKEKFLFVSKAEKTIFVERGYTLDTDFSLVLQDLSKEMEALKQEIENVKSPQNFELAVVDIIRKKEKFSVGGRNAEDTAGDFKKLNYLLDLKFNPLESQRCEIPGAPGRDDRELELAKARAKARKRRIRILALK